MNGFDGNTETQYGDKKAYFDGIAAYISYMITFNKVLALKTKIRKERNIYAVFDNYLKPLLYAE